LKGDSREESSEALLDAADGAIRELSRVALADIETPVAAACPF
jgi:hypothetical protein